MLGFPAFSRLRNLLLHARIRRRVLISCRFTPGNLSWLCSAILLGFAIPANAVVLWNDPGETLIRENGAGSDIVGGAVKRDDTANDTLYFKLHVDPLSDKDTEEYFAAFELFDGDVERLGIGNAAKAWAYSALFHTDETGESNNLAGYVDLRTLKPESASAGSGSYQYPRRDTGVTIVFKIQYVAGEDDLVTVWLNPDLGPGASESYQPEGLTTRFNADASFDEIRLRHSGRGGGWIFGDLAIATSFSDFVDVSSARPTVANAGGGNGAVSVQSWQKEQGLPQSPVRALLQSQDGYLWIGNDEGLVRFDGLRFVSFGNQDGLRGGPVTALFEDIHGAIWIGSADSGLSRWQNNRVVTYTIHDGLPANSITALAEDAAGRLWIGTGAGVIIWQDGKLVPPDPAAAFKGQFITALFKDRQGRMWMGVRGAGVFQYANNHVVPLVGDSVEELIKDSHCLLVDRSARIWVGAGSDTVLCRDENRWHRYRIPRTQAKSFVSTLAEEPDGTVWAGSAGGGLLQFWEGKSFSLPPGGGLVGSLIQSLLTDREGKLWVGTEAGLNRLRRKNLVTLSQSEGLGFGAAQGMAEVAAGIIWVAKPNDGLYRWDGKSFNRVSAGGLLPHDSLITSLLVTHDGYCWVATTNNLLLYKDPIAAADEAQVIRAKPNIVSLAEDRDGALWIGTRDGKLWQLREGAWQAQTNFMSPVTAIVPNADGSLWIGTDGNGLFRFGNKAPQHLGRSEGLSSDFIRTLYLDTQGTLWIGTVDGGLNRWRNGHINTFRSREGFPDSNISQILEDDAGRLWLGTGVGIVCVSKHRLEQVAAGKVSAVYPQVFGRAEGMLSQECTGGFFPAGLKTGSGLLWFSTSKGVVVVNPRAQPPASIAPNTVLEDVLVDRVPDPMFQVSNPKSASWYGQPDKGISPVETLQITPGRHRVEFRYTGLNFDAPEQIRFRYRLEGLDLDWVDAGTRRTAFYSYLPPGNYRFHVGASSSDGSWSESVSGVDLVVLRHFWQTWWFITLASLALLFSVGGTVRIVEKRKLHQRLKRVEQERALERERTRIAQDLHDEMGAKLCRISFLSEHARSGDLQPHEVQNQIASISDASREVLHSLDEIVWAVNPQNDTLEHVASYIGQYAQEYFQMTGVECELDIPTQLPAHPLSSQMRHHLFLAAHEALTNILKHAGATRARVAMSCSDGQLEIKISDNGKGFNTSNAGSEVETAATSAGNGLINMRRRLADVGGRCSVDSAPGKGTKIRFVFPLNHSTKEPR